MKPIASRVSRAYTMIFCSNIATSLDHSLGQPFSGYCISCSPLQASIQRVFEPNPALYLCLFIWTPMTDVGKLRSCMSVSVVVFKSEILRGVSLTCSPACIKERLTKLQG